MAVDTISEDEDIHTDQLAPLYFLDRSDKWNSIKPYKFHYFPKEHIPLHNLSRSPHAVPIRSMRSLTPTLSLDVQGFEVHRLESKMKYSDFKDNSLISTIYIDELEQHFQKALGAKQVRALDYQIRLRDATFPYFGGKPPSNPQPSLMTHVDITRASTELMVHELYGDAAAQIMQSRFQVITVWKPLRLPVRDWPLAVCDASTVDLHDLVDMDVLYPNYLAENRMVHFNENQRWYWLPDQSPDEVIVFKAVDSDRMDSSPCPHGAFPLPPKYGDHPVRESIDMRLLVMHADMVYPESKAWSASIPY